jgi:transposase
MADRETWTKRVEEWRASGLKAEAFCAGRGFFPQTLYRWSSRLRKPPRQERPEPVRMARVVRRPERREASSSAPAAAAWVEYEGARIVVAPGADRTTLLAVLEALKAAAGGASR